MSPLHREDGEEGDVGDETEVLTRPKGKDLEVQQVVDLRRMFTDAGYLEVAEELDAKGKEV